MAVACPSIVAGLGGNLCEAVDHYCERMSDAVWAEPVNTLTNLAFLMAAWGAWALLAKVPDAQPRGQLRVLILLMALVGVGSFLFHALGTRWAEFGDTGPIGLFLLLYMWIFLTHFFDLAVWQRLATLALVGGAAAFAEVAVPGTVMAGGALYVPVVIALIVLGTWLSLKTPVAGMAMLAATSVWGVSLIVRTLDQAVCPAFPLGTHFLWHITNAIVLYLFVSVVVLYDRGAARPISP